MGWCVGCEQLTGLLLKKNVRLLWVLSGVARARLLPASLPSVVRVTSYVAQLSVLAHSAVRLAVTHATLTAAQVSQSHHHTTTPLSLAAHSVALLSRPFL